MTAWLMTPGRRRHGRFCRGVRAYSREREAAQLLTRSGGSAPAAADLPPEAQDPARWGIPARMVPLKEVARKARVDESTMRTWCRNGWVLAEHLASGHGPWLVAVDVRGLPCDAPAKTSKGQA